MYFDVVLYDFNEWFKSFRKQLYRQLQISPLEDLRIGINDM